MRIFLKRFASIAVLIGLAVINGIRLVLELIGWSTAPEDVDTAMSRVDSFFYWLLSIPWPVTWGSLVLVALWLMWVSWPRQQATAGPAPSKRPATGQGSLWAKSLRVISVRDAAAAFAGINPTEYESSPLAKAIANEIKIAVSVGRLPRGAETAGRDVHVLFHSGSDVASYGSHPLDEITDNEMISTVYLSHVFRDRDWDKRWLEREKN